MHEQVEVLPVDRLALEQRLRDALEQVLVLLQQDARLGVRLVEQALDLVVHHLGGALGHLAPLAELPAEEDFLLPVADGHDADPLAHAELRHHPAGQRRWPARCRCRRPVVTFSGPKISSSATRPPKNMARLPISQSLV